MYFLSLLLWSFLAHAQMTNPQPYGQMGEVEPLYLWDKKIFIQTFNNDFLGQTDKYMTNSLGLSYRFDNHVEFGFYRRLYTPSLSKDLNAPDFETPVGVLADDLVFRLSTGYKVKDFAFYPELSVNFIGDYNVEEAYNVVHKVIGAPLNFDKFGKEKKATRLSPGIKIVYEKDQYQMGGGFYSSPFMDDLYVLVGTQQVLAPNIKFSIQYKFIWQVNSNFYEYINESYRQELKMGLKYKNFIPYINYNSSFLKPDNVPQWYISPLNFNFNW